MITATTIGIGTAAHVDAALGTQVAYFNDPDGTNLEIIAPKGGFSN